MVDRRGSVVCQAQSSGHVQCQNGCGNNSSNDIIIIIHDIWHVVSEKGERIYQQSSGNKVMTSASHLLPSYQPPSAKQHIMCYRVQQSYSSINSGYQHSQVMNVRTLMIYQRN